MLARSLSLPPQFLQRAEVIASCIAKESERKRTASGSYLVARRRKLVLGLVESLGHARGSVMEEPDLCAHLRALQDEFVTQMHELHVSQQQEGTDRRQSV